MSGFPILNRGDAVNLACNVLAGERVSQAGIEALAEAVVAMDEHIRKLTEPKTIAEWQAAKVAPIREGNHDKK